jgi:type IV pilus assembly protein PilB
MGIESFLIASSVLAIVSQRLVRRICPSCKTTYVPSEAELAFYRESGGPEKEVFYYGAGCNFCSNTGYRDRIGVYELLRTLRHEAANLVAQDITTVAEAIRSVHAL